MEHFRKASRPVEVHIFRFIFAQRASAVDAVTRSPQYHSLIRARDFLSQQAAMATAVRGSAHMYWVPFFLLVFFLIFCGFLKKACWTHGLWTYSYMTLFTFTTRIVDISHSFPRQTRFSANSTTGGYVQAEEIPLIAPQRPECKPVAGCADEPSTNTRDSRSGVVINNPDAFVPIRADLDQQ